MDKYLFGQKILLLRIRSKLTQKQLSDKVGCSSAAIGWYERGEKIPTIETAAKIAKALDVSLDWLAYGEITFTGINAPEIKK